MVAVADEEEVAYAIIEPHFDAVRDHFTQYVTDDGTDLRKVARTKLVVDSSVRNSDRHYAACRDDGLLIKIAPQAAWLDVDTLVALICHEFGHATDFLYPARWEHRRDDAAVWIDEDAPKMTRRRRAWANRNDDTVEWAADSIAYAIIGRRIEYCGPCMVQCFEGGVGRPPGLR